jgi:hypothetical protein
MSGLPARISTRAPRRPAVTAALLLLLSLCGSAAAPAHAQGLEDDGGASWRLEQPAPPPPPPGVQGSPTPIGLGPIGDIEFWAPNRGLLTTAGNGSTIPPGLWAYDGEGWHELATVCGATDGRIAWAGPDEFWTISDGRPGQASVNGKIPPTTDNTLCHFSGGQVVASYASLAFQASSYQPMHAAGCIVPPPARAQSDCWFAGDPLPEPGIGAFHLYWDGHTLKAEPNPQGHAVRDIRPFEHRLFESVRIRPSQEPPKPSEEDQLSEPESPSEPSVLHEISPAGVQPTFVSLLPGLPVYAPSSFPAALDFLHLGADADSLWGAAGATRETPPGSTPAQMTVVRYAEGQWSQPLGPGMEPEGGNPFAQQAVNAIAAEPASTSAWMAVDSQDDAASPSPTAPATVARISADGTISDAQNLPSAEEGAIGNKGAAERIACPAPHDCWMATTQGWLFHLSDGGKLPRDNDPAFTGPITFRPPDEGLPQVVPDAPPVDDSGLLGERTVPAPAILESTPEAESRVTLPLVSAIHSRLVHGTMLELRFHLAVKARVRLIAKRKRSVVARTATRTFARGNRKLTLRLDRRRWPTKLDLQTHALAPLPTASTRGAANNSVSTSLVFPAALGPPQRLVPFAASGPLL